MKKYKQAIVIGRFQPFHNGHFELVKKAAEIAERKKRRISEIRARAEADFQPNTSSSKKDKRRACSERPKRKRRTGQLTLFDNESRQK